MSTILEHLDRTGLARRLESVEPEAVPREVLELAHSPEYVRLLWEIDDAGGGRVDLDTRMGSGSLAAVLVSSGAAVEAAARILDGRWSSAFVVARPPGHHATYDGPLSQPAWTAVRASLGFCLVNHAAVAARWAIHHGGAARVAILDWDAHHGNGTQDVFWEDPQVLFMSVHQFPFYPGTGDVTETGGASADGLTVNVPLPAGSGEDAYARAFEEVFVPAARKFDPDLLIVSAGFDAHVRDPVCLMGLTAGAFHRFTRMLQRIGPGLLCVLEGGYDLSALSWSSASTVSALVGEAEPVGVPPDEVGALPGATEAHRWVDRAAAHLS